MGWKDQKKFFEHMAKTADNNIKYWKNFNRRKKRKEKRETKEKEKSTEKK